MTEQKPGQGSGLSIVAAALAMPVLIAWLLAPLLATRSWAWRRNRWRQPWAAAAGALGACAAWWGAGAALLDGHWWTLAACLGTAWVCVIPAAMTALRLRLRLIATRVSEGSANPVHADAVRRAMEDGLTGDAQARGARGLPLLLDGRPVVGIVAERDLRDPLTRLRRPAAPQPQDWVSGQHVVMPLDERSPTHHVVVAGSGAGKTTLLRRLAAAHLAAGWRVLILDLKGDEGDREAWLSAADGYRTRVWPGESVDLFRGRADKVAAKIERLMPSDGPGYYRARLTLALHYLIAASERAAPRSPAEVLHRFAKPNLFTDAEGLRFLNARSGGRLVADEVAAEVAAVGHRWTGRHWAWA